MSKKQKGKGPFFFFMLDFIQKEEKKGRRMDMARAQGPAGAIWEKMSTSERAPYVSRSKNDRIQSRVSTEKYTSQGTPLSFIENKKTEKDTAERLMKKEIEDTIRQCSTDNTLAEHRFYFIMFNYFVRTTDNDFLPAEVSLSEYSLKDGVSNKFHSYVNPGELGIGFAYEAREHAESSHKLPLPPNALGEKDFGKLFNEIIAFIQSGNQDCVLPPVYTHSEAIPIVKSGLEMLKADFIDADNCHIKVYPIQYLFYTLKKATTEIGQLKPPESVFISDAIFERDLYEHQTGIACHHHETIDASKFCTLSFVVRWGFTFSDYMCCDLALKMIPGTHVPFNSDLTITSSANLKYDTDDTKSNISLVASSAVSSNLTNYTQPKIERSVASNYYNDYPSLGGPSRTVSKRSSSNQIDDDNNEDVIKKFEDADNETNVKKENPWTARNKNIPRAPTDESFNFDTIVPGRGRGIFIKNENEPATTSQTKPVGRGRFF